MSDCYGGAQRAWRRAKGFRCPYIALMQAADAGHGLNLTAADVAYLASDGAIATVASNHAEEVMPESEA